MLQALVHEMNTYDESVMEAVKYLNVKPSTDDYNRYDITILVNDKPIDWCSPSDYGGSPIHSKAINIEIYMPKIDEDDENEKAIEYDITITQSNLVGMKMDEGIYYYHHKESGDEFKISFKKHVEKRLSALELYGQLA